MIADLSGRCIRNDRGSKTDDGSGEKILPLSMEEVQAKYKKYLDEYRNYFGK
jgi:hypothetical protein